MRRVQRGMRLGVFFIFVLIGTALATQAYMDNFNTQYGTLGTALNTCALCHPAGGGNNAGNLNSYATDFAANAHSFTAIENLDSDSDGFTNIVEINARTFPGDPASFPADTIPPVVTAFTITPTSASLTVPILTFAATDNVAVTGYIVTEAATPAPAAAAAGWAATPPTSYTFASAGAKTLYAWAKDAAGNVSASLNDLVTITLLDAIAPTVTAFTISPTSASLTVPILSFTATDNVAVTGYIVTEAASPAPAAGAAGWTAAPPANYTFASAGAKTLYAWAKDAAGNVSASLNDLVTITLLDAIAPTVTAFTISPTSASLTVPILSFTATDNVAVTGYFVTESITTPLASDPGWTATPPLNYTFATEGSKILYAWAKDAAGNVSTSLSDSVVVALPALQAPVLVSPANGSGGVALTPTLQISASFPDATGNSHKSTDWQIAADAAFAPAGLILSAVQDSVNLTSLVVPPGILRQGTTYYWRARTTNSANTASPYAAASSFTTVTVAMDATGTLPNALTVRSAGVQVLNLALLSPAELAAAGNISSQLVSGPNSVPLVNAGAGTNTALPGMMIAKANGGAGADVLGVVTPAGTVIENITTAATAANPAFRTASPVGVSLPYGVVSFRISGITPGASATVTLYTPADLPANALWCKYSPTRGWLKSDSTGTYDSSGALVSASTKFSVVSGRGVLTIKDDDVTDFSTELVAAGNAVILDPGGPGSPSTVGPTTDSGSGSRCFIATAAFGSPLNPYVKILRDFRDAYLLTHEAGRTFVAFYYRVSPDLADRIGANETLRLAVRIALLPAIGFSILALKVGMPASIMLLLGTLATALLLKRRYRRRKQVMGC